LYTVHQRPGISRPRTVRDTYYTTHVRRRDRRIIPLREPRVKKTIPENNDEHYNVRRLNGGWKTQFVRSVVNGFGPWPVTRSRRRCGWLGDLSWFITEHRGVSLAESFYVIDDVPRGVPVMAVRGAASRSSSFVHECVWMSVLPRLDRRTFVAENWVERSSDAAGVGGGDSVTCGLTKVTPPCCRARRPGIWHVLRQFMLWPLVWTGSLSDADLSPNGMAAVFSVSTSRFFSQTTAESTWLWSFLAAWRFPVLVQSKTWCRRQTGSVPFLGWLERRLCGSWREGARDLPP